MRFFVVENHIRDGSKLATFIADIVFDVESRGRILLERVSIAKLRGGMAQMRTLSSSSVNMYLRTTTFSYLAVGSVETSSSLLQSASLLQ